MAKLGLTSGCSYSFFLDIANLPGHSFPCGVYIAQYFESSVAFVEAVGEGGEGEDGLLFIN